MALQDELKRIGQTTKRFGQQVAKPFIGTATGKTPSQMDAVAPVKPQRAVGSIGVAPTTMMGAPQAPVEQATSLGTEGKVPGLGQVQQSNIPFIQDQFKSLISQPRREEQRQRLGQDLGIAAESQRRALESGVGQGAFGGPGSTIAGAAERMQEAGFLGERGRALSDFEIAQDKLVAETLPAFANLELSLRQQGNTEALQQWALAKEIYQDAVSRGDTESIKELTPMLNQIAERSGFDFKVPEFRPGKSVIEQSLESQGKIDSFLQEGKQTGFITIGDQRVEFTPQMEEALTAMGESLPELLGLASEDSIDGDDFAAITDNGVISVMVGDSPVILQMEEFTTKDGQPITGLTQASVEKSIQKDERLQGLTLQDSRRLAARIYAKSLEGGRPKQAPQQEQVAEETVRVTLPNGQIIQAGVGEIIPNVGDEGQSARVLPGGQLQFIQ